MDSQRDLWWRGRGGGGGGGFVMGGCGVETTCQSLEECEIRVSQFEGLIVSAMCAVVSPPVLVRTFIWSASYFDGYHPAAVTFEISILHTLMPSTSHVFPRQASVVVVEKTTRVESGAWCWSE
ncbi:hypothetical protein OIU84_010701 [Salix udensis]|uniref:Uncharacterized protein n=1 Tax=Salix udensis TaxID=889485 RepID=A0AAD6NW58_9ROSI|nr:hypothetical protein OIU84_010701 [Salix udensis]